MVGPKGQLVEHRVPDPPPAARRHCWVTGSKDSPARTLALSSGGTPQREVVRAGRVRQKTTALWSFNGYRATYSGAALVAMLEAMHEVRPTFERRVFERWVDEQYAAQNSRVIGFLILLRVFEGRTVAASFSPVMQSRSVGAADQSSAQEDDDKGQDEQPARA